jgi:hypothetical protein
MIGDSVAKPSDFQTTFERLKTLLEPYEAQLNVTNDTGTNYCLETDHVMQNKRRLFFAGIRVRKSYVSYYLMPVYGCPELLEGISPELKKRMQGKSCFHFKTVDDELFKELGKLTNAGFQKFSNAKVIEKLLYR